MILRGGYPDLDVPRTGLPEFLLGSLTPDELDRPAAVAADTCLGYTYRQLRHATERVAAALAERGIGPGDVAALCAPNTPDYPAALYGVLSAGAAVSPANSLYTPGELAHQLRDSSATILFSTADALPRARASVLEAGVRVREIVVLDNPTPNPAGPKATRPGTTAYPPAPTIPAATRSPVPETPFAQLLATERPPPGIPIDPDSLAALPYSSGTTGLAKGVLLSHRNLAVNVLQSLPLGRIGPESRVLAVLPLFHIYGLTGILNHTLYRRARLVTMPRFELTAFLAAIAEHRVDHLFIAPPIALALANSPLVDNYDLSSVRIVLSAAAPLDAGLARALGRRLGAEVRQGYGLTESSPCTHGIPADRPDIDPGSIGVLMPSVEARVVDPATGRDTEPGQPGELWCRGPNIMRGYLNNPEATAAALDADGFLHTGDLVTVDTDGVFRVVDRLKKLIKYNGFQVAPAELEALLLTHPGVADTAVVGAPDAQGREVPKAFVVTKPDHPRPAAQELMEFVADRVAPYKKVRLVEFIPEIPKSSAGKILRRNLRTRRTPPPPDTPNAGH